MYVYTEVAIHIYNEIAWRYIYIIERGLMQKCTYVCMYKGCHLYAVYSLCIHNLFQLDPSRAQLAGCESRAVLASHRKQWCLI